MPFTSVNNTALTNAGNAVPAPFGPFARVGSAPTVAPNSNIPVHFTAFSGTVDVHVDYDTLSNPARLAEFIKNRFGIDYVVYQLRLAVEVINAHLGDIAPPLTTAAEEQAILKSLSIIPTLFGTLPWKALTEYDKSLEVQVDFAGTPDGADLELVQDISGQYFWYLWDFGDGETSIEEDPTHEYAADGTYVVRLIVIGAGGIKEVRKSFTINVP